MTSKYLRIDGTDSAVKLYIDRAINYSPTGTLSAFDLKQDLICRFGFDPSHPVDSTGGVGKNWVHYRVNSSGNIDYKLKN